MQNEIVCKLHDDACAVGARIIRMIVKGSTIKLKFSLATPFPGGTGIGEMREVASCHNERRARGQECFFFSAIKVPWKLLNMAKAHLILYVNSFCMK